MTLDTELLQKYARLIVGAGANVQKGQIVSLYADAGQSALDVFADRLMAFTGVVQIGHAGEVGEFAGSFVKGVVLFQGLHRGVIVGR